MAFEHAEKLYFLGISAIRKKIFNLSNDNINQAIVAVMLIFAVYFRISDSSFSILIPRLAMS